MPITAAQYAAALDWGLDQMRRNKVPTHADEETDGVIWQVQAAVEVVQDVGALHDRIYELLDKAPNVDILEDSNHSFLMSFAVAPGTESPLTTLDSETNSQLIKKIVQGSKDMKQNPMKAKKGKRATGAQAGNADGSDDGDGVHEMAMGRSKKRARLQ